MDFMKVQHSAVVVRSLVAIWKDDPCRKAQHLSLELYRITGIHYTRRWTALAKQWDIIKYSNTQPGKTNAI